MEVDNFLVQFKTMSLPDLISVYVQSKIENPELIEQILNEDIIDAIISLNAAIEKSIEEVTGKSKQIRADVDNLTPAQTVAYYLMERKPMNISQFAKEFSKALDKKVDPSELKELYQQTRDMLILKDIGYAEGLSTDEEINNDLRLLEEKKINRIRELKAQAENARSKSAETPQQTIQRILDKYRKQD